MSKEMREQIDKIKNFGEFLNENDNSNIILYHGTNTNFNKFDIEKSGLIKNSDWGKGIYFTTDYETAKSYGIDAVKSQNNDYNKTFINYEKANRDIKNHKFGTKEYDNAYELADKYLKNFQRIGKDLNSTKEFKVITAKIKSNAKIYKYNSNGGSTDPFLGDKVKNKGYDIILVDEGKFTEEYVVLNTNSIVIM